MAVARFRIGLHVPGSFAATWPLVGLQFDEQGFEFRGPFLRRFVSTAVGMQHEWREVATLRVSRNRATLVFVDGRRARIVGLSQRHRECLAVAAQSGGVTLL
jgi:hypothetical protein